MEGKPLGVNREVRQENPERKSWSSFGTIYYESQEYLTKKPGTMLRVEKDTQSILCLVQFRTLCLCGTEEGLERETPGRETRWEAIPVAQAGGDTGQG